MCLWGKLNLLGEDRHKGTPVGYHGEASMCFVPHEIGSRCSFLKDCSFDLIMGVALNHRTRILIIMDTLKLSFLASLACACTWYVHHIMVRQMGARNKVMFRFFLVDLPLSF